MRKVSQGDDEEVLWVTTDRILFRGTILRTDHSKVKPQPVLQPESWSERSGADSSPSEPGKRAVHGDRQEESLSDESQEGRLQGLRKRQTPEDSFLQS